MTDITSTRHHVNITMTQAKAVSNYTNSILANMEATDEVATTACYLTSGFVSEGAGENIFVVKTALPPDLSAVRSTASPATPSSHIAKDLGLSHRAKRITRDEVYIADEAFFTGTAAEVTPSASWIRIELGKGDYVGSRGPITEKIQTAFFDIVNGRNPNTPTGSPRFDHVPSSCRSSGQDLNAQGACSAPIPRPT